MMIGKGDDLPVSAIPADEQRIQTELQNGRNVIFLEKVAHRN